MTTRDVSFGDALQGVAGQLERHTTLLSEISDRTVDGSVVVREASAEIVAAVQWYGDGVLAALGSHGSGLARRLVLGSVSTKVLHAVRGSVLIVPPRHRTASAP